MIILIQVTNHDSELINEKQTGGLLNRFNIKNYFLLFLFCASFTFSQQSFDKAESISLIKYNVETLASDQFEGRETGTRGELLSSEFIAGRLKEYGVKPFGDDGSYFQNFELNVRRIDRAAGITVLNNSGDKNFYESGKDIYISLRKFPSEKYAGINLDLVFCGYGITSEESNYNDYEGIDIKGKVVLLLPGIPINSDKEVLSENEAKYFKSIYNKYSLAFEKGAAGVLCAADGWMKKNWGYMLFSAYDKDVYLRNFNSNETNNIPLVLITENIAEQLLDGENKSYNEILFDVNENKPAAFRLKKKISFNYSTYSDVDTVRNVIGIIEGSDENLKDEYIALSAHYDHEGMRDSLIFYGADDNASGTSAVLEIGRRLAQLNSNSRSVLTIFHTGEEKGLLGSKYFTANSDIMNEINANINLDMVGRESIDTIYSVGSGKLSSQLFELVEEVNHETVDFVFNYKFDDPDDPEKIYYRSDHYNYAKQGIPIVFFYDYMTTDYHKPTDTADKIIFAKIEKISTLVTELALRIANLEERLIVDKKEDEKVLE